MANASPATYSAHLAAAKNTPAQQWTNFDLGLQKVENNIGLKLIPKLEASANWLGKNETAVKDVATGIGILLIPALAAYSAKLVMGGIANTQRFVGVLRGTGVAAEGSVGGLNKMGAAAMGVTAAIGVFELGQATRSHGAAGAVTASLGGALTGMTVGLAVGGPWGAAVGAAGGALVGLAGHFYDAKKQVDGTNSSLKAMISNMTQALQLDKNVAGANTAGLINQWLYANPAAAKAFNKAGIKMPDLLKYLQAGGQYAIPGITGVVAGQYGLGAGGRPIDNMGNIAAVQGLQQFLSSYLSALATSTAVTGINSPSGQIAKNGGIVIHNHVHLDGKEITSSVKKHLQGEVARR